MINNGKHITKNPNTLVWHEVSACDLSLSAQIGSAYDPLSLGYIIQWRVAASPPLWKYLQKRVFCATVPQTSSNDPLLPCCNESGATRFPVTSISQVYQPVSISLKDSSCCEGTWLISRESEFSTKQPNEHDCCRWRRSYADLQRLAVIKSGELHLVKCVS